jgi:hypothetical protein
MAERPRFVVDSETFRQIVAASDVEQKFEF